MGISIFLKRFTTITILMAATKDQHCPYHYNFNGKRR